MYECDGTKSPCNDITDPDEIKLLEGKGFVIDGNDFSDFPEGSDGNDGTYIVESIEKNICGKIPPEDEVTIRVKKDHQITNKNPGLSDLGTINLKTKDLFRNMVGGVFGKKHYYYKFENPLNTKPDTKWTEKFDSSDLNGDPNQDGDYSEIGIPGYSSNTIIFNKKIDPGTKLEIIINSTLNANY